MSPYNFSRLGVGNILSASNTQRKEAEIKFNRAWELYLQGVQQFAIAAELDCMQSWVSQFIKQSAKAHPINQLTLEERMAVSEERWNMSERELREQIAIQRQRRRTVTETFTDAMGRTTV